MQNRFSEQIPNYFLYGDQSADVERDFLHIEPIRDRSGPSDWRIHPHAHPEHMQLILVREGGGTIRLEERQLNIPAPAILVIPAGIVHQIDFTHGTDGYVLTAALACLQAAAIEPRVREAVATPAVHPLPAGDPATPSTLEAFERLHAEFLWTAPGRRAMAMAHYTAILVAVLRLVIAREATRTALPDRDYELVMRYRALLEKHFRKERSPGFYADELAVTSARLNAACKARAGRTASDMLYDRLIVEAKRYLVYTESSVSQVAHMTGFDDPAYFNRFFARRVGLAPGAFRKRAVLERI